MPPTINRLSCQLINQIAAGEVVENPASAIKELIENSLDAGSSHIDVFIKSGGFLSILIIDNGCGIRADEALIAFERHTTSKLSALEDLSIHLKMGFRGEALASIASCSKVILKTATQEGSGVVVELHGGELIAQKPAVLKKGTSIEIKDLFYNTPARKKFQKSVSHSIQEIQKMMTSLILAHPQVNFRLKSDETFLLNASVDASSDFKKAFKKRIYDHFAHLKVDEGTFLDLNDPMVSILGYLAPLSESANTRKNQHFIVNSRPIEAPNLCYAIAEALKTYLPEKRFFQGVFHLNIDPKWIDINIHPQKKQIKFAEEGYIKELLQQAVNPKKGIDSFKPQQPIPVFNYDLSVKTQHPEYEQVKIFETPQYVLTIGYYPPYLLIQADQLPWLKQKQGLVLFDVKSAFIDQKLEQLLKTQKGIVSQTLIIPHPLRLSKGQQELLINCKNRLFELGFDFDQQLDLSALPADCELSLAQETITTLLEGFEKQLCQQELIALYVNTIYRPKNLDRQQAQTLIALYQTQAHSPYFCFISDAQLKELFFKS